MDITETTKKVLKIVNDSPYGRIDMDSLEAGEIWKVLNAASEADDIHDVADSQFTDLKEPEPLLITRLPEFEGPWIDLNEPIINYKKHKQTCSKNRNKRKKNRRG